MKQARDIRALAHGYLLDKPEGWFNVSKVASAEMARNLAMGLGDQVKESGTEVAPFIEDAMLTWFLAPDTVKVLCALDNDSAAREWLCTEMREHLPIMQVAEYETGTHRDEEIIDVADGEGDERWAIRRWDATDWDAYNAPRVLSVFRPAEVNLLDLPIGDYLSEALDTARTHHGQRPENSETRMVRFDAIDRVLYDALLRHPELGRDLDWRVFEELLADILRRFGYEVELQQGTKDGGIDIVAVKRTTSLGPHRYLLQAKRSQNRIGVEPVRQLLFLHQHHRVTKSCLATTAEFTHGALELARQYPWQIELRDSEGIQKWIKEAAALRM